MRPEYDILNYGGSYILKTEDLATLTSIKSIFEITWNYIDNTAVKGLTTRNLMVGGRAERSNALIGWSVKLEMFLCVCIS